MLCHQVGKVRTVLQETTDLILIFCSKIYIFNVIIILYSLKEAFYPRPIESTSTAAHQRHTIDQW